MKKLLLGTSALIGAASLATAAHANGPTITLGGFADFQAGIADQDLDTTGTQYGRDVKFQNDTEIHVKVNGEADNGLRYGAVVELEADVSADADNEGVNADKTYLFLESELGRVEMGANSSASHTMRVESSTFARATGGTDGDWYDYVNFGGTNYIISPELPTAHANGVAEDATKLTYYTPRFSGFQAGVSYTPDSGNVGTAAGFSTDTDVGTFANPQFENVFNLGLNYTGQFDDVGLALSATGEFGQSEVATQEDLSAYALGANLSYMGFTVGGSYGDWSDSGQTVGSNADASYWDAGIAYETGPFGVSLSYIDSEYGANDNQNLIVGADYELAPGLVPYVEVSFFNLDTTGTVLDNDGTVFLVGSQLNF